MPDRATPAGLAPATVRRTPEGREFAAERARRDHALLKRYRDRGDPVDLDTVVKRFLPLARQLAARYQRPGEPFDDVFQVACLGLVKAVRRFDVARGVVFSSYAVPTITGEIKRHFRDRTWSVRVPRELQDLALRVERVVGSLTHELGRQPSVTQVAHAANASEEEVLEAMQVASAYRSASLDAPRASGDEEASETLGDAIGVADGGYELAELRSVLHRLMDALTRREREMIRLRFEEDLTQAEIGERIGVSQMQVSRLLRGAIMRLRTITAAHDNQTPPDRS